MKAVLFHSHGGPEKLEYGEFPKPEPGTGEVLIRLHAAALNRVDIFVREGWPGLKLEMPHIPGADGAGEVESLGSGATGFSPGDHVVINSNLGCGECDFCLKGQDNLCRRWELLGETRRGTYAEYIALPIRQLYRLPIDFNYCLAAAAALAYQTAWHSLMVRGGLQPGEIVLIVGAGGGVNTASIQIARLHEARVIVIGSDRRKLDHARLLGADILIDRSIEPDWSRAAYLATEKRGVDIVVDNVGITFPLSMRCLRKGGRLLTVGNSGGPRFEIDNRYIFSKHLSILGSTMSTRDEFTQVMDLVVAGKLIPPIDSTFPLQEAADAQERMRRGEHFGKITLAM
jgi:NADPH:quinone reductase-like Zn-dependent oxidoreductase